VQLPGRGPRVDERSHTRMQPLIEAMLAEVQLEPPFALFGHSLGALVAFELARALVAAGLSGPSWLLLSAHRSPELPWRGERLTGLPDEALAEALNRSHGGAIPAEVLEDPELRELVLPPLRADIELVESYVHRLGARLDCPLVVTGGQQDGTTPSELEPWRAHTTGRFSMALYPGGHFYLREQRAALLRLIDETIRAPESEP
jgi:surfactin synthase thioesterase subunit